MGKREDLDHEVIVVRRGYLPKHLNSVGCTLLCQALFVNAIKNNDKEFFSYQLGELCCDLASWNNGYNLKKVIINAKKIPHQKWNLEELAEKAKTMSANELASYYNLKIKDIRTALWRANASRSPRREAQKKLELELRSYKGKYTASELAKLTGQPEGKVRMTLLRKNIEYKRCNI